MKQGHSQIVYLSRGNEMSGHADVSLETCLGDDRHLLPLLDHSRRVDFIALLLSDSKRLACQGRLVHQQVAICLCARGRESQESCIRWDNIAQSQNNDVSRYKDRGVELLQLSIAPTAGFESQRLAQSVDC